MKIAAAASGGSSLPGREKTAIWLKAGCDGTWKAYCVGEMACGCASTGRPEIRRPNMTACCQQDSNCDMYSDTNDLTCTTFLLTNPSTCKFIVALRIRAVGPALSSRVTGTFSKPPSPSLGLLGIHRNLCNPSSHQPSWTCSRWRKCATCCLQCLR